MRIKPGHSYFDVTHYPLGGCSKRAGIDGELIVDILDRWNRAARGAHGTDTKVQLFDGRIAALDSTVALDAEWEA